MKTFVVLFLIIASTLAFGQSAPALSKGQVLYLPVYSHIWYGDLDKKGKPDFLLFSALVSIRNTDPARPIRIVSAQYYDTEGKRLKEFIASPITIKPLATYELYIAKSDTAGGSGANFVMSWQSDTLVNAPIVEAIHAEVLGTRALAFTTSARQIEGR